MLSEKRPTQYLSLISEKPAFKFYPYLKCPAYVMVIIVLCGTYEGVSFEREGEGIIQMIHLHRSYIIVIILNPSFCRTKVCYDDDHDSSVGQT